MGAFLALWGGIGDFKSLGESLCSGSSTNCKGLQHGGQTGAPGPGPQRNNKGFRKTVFCCLCRFSKCLIYFMFEDVYICSFYCCPLSCDLHCFIFHFQTRSFLVFGSKRSGLHHLQSGKWFNILKSFNNPKKS